MSQGPAGGRALGGRAAAAPLEWAILGYRRLVSPLLPVSCRFYPSCSAYGLTAVRRFGAVRGSWLTGRRLLRCHPFTAGGVDHVPSLPGEQPDGLTQTRWAPRAAACAAYDALGDTRRQT